MLLCFEITQLQDKSVEDIMAAAHSSAELKNGSVEMSITHEKTGK